MAKINITIEKISDLFEENFYQIPQNQRKFEWDQEQALDLLNDIEKDPKGGTFLGNIITLCPPEAEKKFNTDVCQIVDGQQRLTTISIMFIAMRNRLLSLGIQGEQQASLLAAEVQQLITRRFGGESEEHSILEPSNSIEEVYSQASKIDWSGEFIKPKTIHGSTWNSSVARFNKAFKGLKAKIDEYDLDHIKSLFHKIEKARVAHIPLDEITEALDLFERTNARGKSLAVNDLVKNHLFIQEPLEGHQSEWEEIEKNSGKSIVQCLKYFQVSKMGLVPQSRLYGKIKDTIKSEGPLSYTVELRDFSEFYSLMVDEKQNDFESFFAHMNLGLNERLRENAERLSYGLQALKLMKIKQVIPLIYAAIFAASNAKVKKSNQVENTIRLVETLERFHFSYTAICSLRANAFEKTYADYAKKISEENSVSSAYSDLYSKELRKKSLRPHFDDFSENFANLSYSNDKPLIQYAFDKMVNCEVDYWPNRTKIFIDNKNLKEEQSFTIEHIYPQRPETDILELAGTDAIDNIGNLWTLYKKENSSKNFRNNMPEKKISWMNELKSKGKASNYILTFLEQEEKLGADWSESKIQERAELMAKICYEKVFNLECDPAHWTKKN